MSPEIQNLINQQEMEWRTNPSSPGYMGQSRGGYNPASGGLKNDEYGNYLMSLIEANSSDPSFQDKIFGYYLDYKDPRNQKSPYDENILNMALSLMSSEDPQAQEWAKILIQGSFPQLGTANSTTGGYGTPTSYEDILRNQSRDVLKDPSTLSRGDYDWNTFLANASNEQVSAYDEARNKTVVNPWDEYWKGTGTGNPFDSSFWSPEARAKAKMRQLGYY